MHVELNILMLLEPEHMGYGAATHIDPTQEGIILNVHATLISVYVSISTYQNPTVEPPTELENVHYIHYRLHTICYATVMSPT